MRSSTQAQSSSGSVHLFGRIFTKIKTIGRTGIKLGFSRIAWKIVFGYLKSRLLDRSNPDTTRLSTKIRQARGNLSTKMLFALGDFKAAMEQGLCDLEARPDDAEARMLVVGCAIELCDLEIAEHHLNLMNADRIPDHLKDQLPFFRYTVTRQCEPDGLELAVRHLDDLYLAMGCRPIHMSRSCNHDVFESMTSVESTAPVCLDGYPPLYDGPLVSVIMTAYNVEDLVKTSIMSILNQNYCNLELIVVDDCSTDATLEALRLLEGKDERMQVIAKDRNDGTYVSKNIGLLRAEGEYVTFQDSDDWSHPDRLGKSVAVLESKPEIVALTTSYVRMTKEGNLILQRSSHYSLKAYISLVFRRDDVLRRSGYFDSVRAGADTELERRISIQFGEPRVVNYSWPLYFARMRPGSITADTEYGMVRGRAKPVRERYRKAYIKWHTKIGKEHDGYMPFPLRERPFVVPSAILAQSQ